MSFSERQYLSDAPEAIGGASNINMGMMGGNDYLTVEDGIYNFANGNNGDDVFTIKGGLGKYLGGAGNDRISVYRAAIAGSWINGNNGVDIITGNADDVTYRGGADNDWLTCSAGNVWGDKGRDIFGAVPWRESVATHSS